MDMTPDEIRDYLEVIRHTKTMTELVSDAWHVSDPLSKALITSISINLVMIMLLDSEREKYSPIVLKAVDDLINHPKFKTIGGKRMWRSMVHAIKPEWRGITKITLATRYKWQF